MAEICIITIKIDFRCKTRVSSIQRFHWIKKTNVLTVGKLKTLIYGQQSKKSYQKLNLIQNFTMWSNNKRKACRSLSRFVGVYHRPNYDSCVKNVYHGGRNCQRIHSDLLQSLSLASHFLFVKRGVVTTKDISVNDNSKAAFWTNNAMLSMLSRPKTSPLLSKQQKSFLSTGSEFSMFKDNSENGSKKMIKATELNEGNNELKSYADSQTKSISIKENEPMLRLSKVISAYSTNLSISRNKAERLIRDGKVTIAGTPIKSPYQLISLQDAQQIKVRNTLLQIRMNDISFSSKSNNTLPVSNETKTNQSENKIRVWLAHKLSGELVTEEDLYDRPSLLTRLRQGGVGANSSSAATHLKPIGRLDMQTEGLILLTNDGNYAHEMEHPKNEVHRTYRARTFGNWTEAKLNAIRNGRVVINGIKYDAMDVTIDSPTSRRAINERHGHSGRRRSANTLPANNWVQITCKEGKNRMIRKVLHHLRCKCYHQKMICLFIYFVVSLPVVAMHHFL